MATHRRSTRGVGSNQYGDREPHGGQYGDDLALRMRMAENVTVTSSSSSDVTGDALANQPLNSLVANLSEAKRATYEGHGFQFNDKGIVVGNDGPMASEQQTLDLVRIEARNEDAIFHKHPDAYGLAVIEALDWQMKLSSNPKLRSEDRISTSETAKLTDSYIALMQDQVAAPEEQLDADGLEDLLWRIQTNPVRRAQCSDESGDFASEEDRRLRLRHTALSVVCSRSSVSDDLRAEMSRVGMELNSRYEKALGLNENPPQ